MNPTDIIVPVYGAAADLEACLDSLVACTDLDRHGLILVFDGPQDAAVEALLARVPMARLLRNPQRQGFVATVNHGMRSSGRDVLLLNSDTIVTPHWLEQMLVAAASAPDIGTVTPLSNHAALCSVPQRLVENLLPSGLDAAAMADLVRRVAARCYPRIPTAVGFCMWIRRALLDQIGLFDTANFGLGYGEENDFCLRASARGWVHVADDASFVQHLGNRSFRAERALLQQQARKTMQRLHPQYPRLIAQFMANDPLAPVRERISAALAAHCRGYTAGRAGTARPPARVVHVLHGWPPFAVAGTEMYAHWLVRAQLKHREVAVYARTDERSRGQGDVVEWLDEGARVRLVTNHFLQRNPLSRNAIASWTADRDFAGFLREQRPELVHIHHLIGHALSLVQVARRLGIPVVMQLQDWWGLCARVNLTDAQGRRCSGPGLDKCARCAVLTRIRPAALSNRAMHLVRRVAMRRALSGVDAYVMGSRCIRDDYQRAGLLAAGTPVHVLPYGVDLAPRSGLRPPVKRPVRFGFIGSALAHKGLQVATGAFAGIDPAQAVLKVWGHAGTRFAEADKAQVFEQMDVLIMPSVGLESFGLVAREAMARGVPVIATRDGALTEMPAEFFPSGDVPALRALILKYAAEPGAVNEWSQRLPPVKSSDQHALEIEAVYAEVLARRGIGPARVG